MRAALAVRPDAQGAARVLGSWQRVDAATARLACLIDPSFLAEAGWDPRTRVLSLPHEHPLLGWRACPAPGCGNPLYGNARECGSCRRADVSEPPTRHGQRSEERRGEARSVPVAAGELCQVRACERERGNRRYCRVHYERVLKLRRADLSFNEKAWQAAEEAIRLPVEGPSQVSLHGVAARAVVEMLYGLQQRTRTGAATDLGRLRQIASELRGTRASCLADLDADGRTQHKDEPEGGRDLPPEIMRQLCQHLPALEDVSCREIRVAAELIIDTGRRPDEICVLPWDCLEYDEPGHLPVLVYFNHKAARQGRRLPVAHATAGLIIAQKTRVRERFPGTSLGQLKLLPAAYANPHGRRAITESHFGARHRAWIEALPPLLRGDGTEFDKARVIPYAYRHTYAQRHADAGVPVERARRLDGPPQPRHHPRLLHRRGIPAEGSRR